MALKLSDLKGDFQVVDDSNLRLSDLKEGDYQAIDDNANSPQAALEGFGQGATLNYLPQIQAKAEPITDRLFNLFSSEQDQVKPAPWSQLTTNDKNYVDSRDSNIKRHDSFAKNNPYSYHGGQIAGALNTGIIASPSQAATMGGRVAQSGLIGAAYGFLSNPNDVENIVDELQVGPRLKNAVTGTLLSAGAQIGLEKIAKVSKSLAKRIFKAAEGRAAGALGAERGTINKVGDKRTLEVGRYALDKGIIKPSILDNTQNMVDRNAATKERASKLMGQAYDAIDDTGVSEFSPFEAAMRVEDEIGGFWKSPINKSQTKQFENTIDSILLRLKKGDRIPIKEAQKLKEEIGSVANFKNNLDITPREEMARSSYRIIKDMIDETVEKGMETINNNKFGVVIEDIAHKLTLGKKYYGLAKDAQKFLKNKVSSEIGNNQISLTDWITLGSGFGAFGPLGATLSITGKKLIGRYGNQVAALFLDKTGKAILKIPQLSNLPQKNPVLFQALVTKTAKNLEDKYGEDIVNSNKINIDKIKGKNKWLVNGISKISDIIDLSDPTKIEKLLFDKKGESLVHLASGLEAGSKQMKSVINRIEKLFTDLSKGKGKEKYKNSSEYVKDRTGYKKIKESKKQNVKSVSKYKNKDTYDSSGLIPARKEVKKIIDKTGKYLNKSRKEKDVYNNSIMGKSKEEIKKILSMTNNMGR